MTDKVPKKIAANLIERTIGIVHHLIEILIEF